LVVIVEVSALELLARERGNFFIAQSEMPGDIGALETAQRAKTNVVKLREQEGVHEMSAVDRELRIIDRLLRDLQSRWAGAEKSTAAAPIEFRFQLLRARDKNWKMRAKQIVTFNHVRVAFFDYRGQTSDRLALGLVRLLWIDHEQLFPT